MGKRVNNSEESGGLIGPVLGDCPRVKSLGNILPEIAGTKSTDVVFDTLVKKSGDEVGVDDVPSLEYVVLDCVVNFIVVSEAQHLENGEQLEELGNSEPELSALIAEFRAEELEHKATALEEGAERAFAYPVMSAVIRAGCRLAIAVSKRI